jgi:hypothetical protein
MTHVVILYKRFPELFHDNLVQIHVVQALNGMEGVLYKSGHFLFSAVSVVPQHPLDYATFVVSPHLAAMSL